MSSETGDLRFSLHHVGVAVPALDKAESVLSALFGYELVSGPFDDPIQKVSVSFLSLPGDNGCQVELIAPLSETSPIQTVLKSGGGAYHLCLETNDIQAALQHLKAAGCLIVSGPTPATAFDGRSIAWVFAPTKQLVELVESDKRPSTPE